MAQIPDNIASFLAVDFAGNVINVDASILSGVQTTTQANQSTSSIRIPTYTQDDTSKNGSTTVVNNITNTGEPFIVFADSFYIPLVNNDKTNFINSSIYQSGVKIGINTKSPSFLLDVYGGSINISTTNDTKTYGFRIDGNNIAYSDVVNNKIILGDATLLTKVDINTLLLSGLINSPVTGITRYLTINDAGIVSATEDVDAARIKVRGRNATGSTLYKGTVVYMSGATGNRPNFSKAQANAEATSSRTFGIILDDIPNNTDGYALTIGYIDTLDTRTTATNPFTVDTLSAGDTIYLSPTNAGYVTNVKPSAPNHIVYIGKVTRTSPTNGTIVYQIQNGYELDEIHDVAITSKTNKDFIYYDGTSGLWKNSQFDSIMTIGGEVSGTYGNMTLVNNAVIGKTLSTYSLLAGTVSSTDTIVQAFGRLQNQINSLSGSLSYKGTWNADTNTPTITSGSGTNGWFYIVSVGSTGTTIDGNSTWAVGDWIIFNGTKWQRIINSAVTSINGLTGIVILNTDNIDEGATNKYYSNTLVSAYLSGAISSVLTTNLTASRAVISDTSGKISVSTTTSTEVSYLSGVTSAIQTQLNTKEPNIATGTTAQYWRGDKSWQTLNTTAVAEGTNLYYTDARARAAMTGAISGITNTNLSISLALVSDASGKITTSSVTSTELGYVSGVTSSIQTQLNSKQAALTNPITGAGTAGQVLFYTGSTTVAGDTGFVWDNVNKNLGLSVAPPSYKLDVGGDINTTGVYRINGVPISFVSGSGSNNFLAKWNGTGTLTSSSITDSGTSVSIFTAPATAYVFNVKNSANKYFSVWQPTIDSVDAIGLLFHNGSGLLDQTVFGINASKHIFAVGISEVMRIADANTIYIKRTTPISGGGTLQISGSVNITGGSYMIDGSPITGGGGGGAVSSVFGRTGAVTAASGDYSIYQISGVSISSPTSGQVLTYNGANWINAAPSGGSGSTLLSSLSDVSISGTITNGQSLVFDTTISGGRWTNKTLSGGSGAYVGGAGTAGFVPVFTGTTTLGNSIIFQSGTTVTVGDTTNGSLYAVKFFENSDSRLKEIISRDGDVVRFKWKNSDDNGIHIGYIAQEVAEKYPDQVSVRQDGYLAVTYTEILVDKVARLEKRVKELESKIQ